MTPAKTAAQVMGPQMDRLEELAAQLVTVRNTIRAQARDLYTAEQMGDAQTSEAELVAARLRRRVMDLQENLHSAEQELATLRKHHMCTESCRPNAHVAFTGKGLVRELEEQNADLRKQIEELKSAPPAECVSVGRLTRQLDVALSQVSALQRRKEELHIRVADMQDRGSELLELAKQARAEAERLEALLASRDTALAESRELAAGRQRDLDTMADTLAAREAQIRDGRMAQEVTRRELDKARAQLKSITAERDAQQGAKQDAWERLGTIERLVREPAVDAALTTSAIPPYAKTLAEAVRRVRKSLEGFS
jgi:chromosome segregation ATPase